MGSRIIALACLAPLMISTACSRGSEVSHGRDERLGPGQWTVDGVEIGTLQAELEARLGAAEQISFAERSPRYKFERHDIVVTLDKSRRVTHVSGQNLVRDGVVVLETGQSAESIANVLGKGYVIKRFSPTTTGVFTTGSVPLWTEHYYHDGANRIHVFVNARDLIGGIHTASIEDFPLPEN